MVPVILTSCRAPDVRDINNGLKNLYALLGAGPEDRFCFAPSGGSAIHTIFLSHYMDFVRKTGRNHILTLPGCETAVQSSMRQLEHLGCCEKELPLNAQGQLVPAALEEAIKPRTSLLSISWAHGLTGVIQPIDEIAEICKSHEVRLHLDATHAIGKLFFHFRHLNVDYLSFDGAGLGAGDGTGGFLVRGPIPIENVSPLYAAGLSSLIAALDKLMHYFDHLSTETARLRDKLEKGIVSAFPDAVPFFQNVERLPNTSVIGFPGVSSDALLFTLERKGIYAASGLANTLIACGVDPLLAEAALSFTLSYDTTEEQIDFTIEQIAALAKKLRATSHELL